MIAASPLRTTTYADTKPRSTRSQADAASGAAVVGGAVVVVVVATREVEGEDGCVVADPAVVVVVPTADPSRLQAMAVTPSAAIARLPDEKRRMNVLRLSGSGMSSPPENLAP